MRMREKINWLGSIQDMIVIMSEGNPGALRVLCEIAQRDPLDILHLDDMNIRGPQIWVGYKDFAKEDLKYFVYSFKKRSEEMISVINEQCSVGCGLAVKSKRFEKPRRYF